jgi:site-specific DNA recombinase
MKDAVREGRYVWPAPIGFENIKVAGKANIAPSSVAPLIKRVFDEVAKGDRAVTEIRNEAISKGLRTKSGKAVGRSNFYCLLRNEIYAGQIVKFGERHTGAFKPIISRELFALVQKVLKGGKPRNGQYVKDRSEFPLRQFLIHPSGNKLKGCWSKGRRIKYPYYFYRNPYQGFKAEELNRQFLAYLNSFRVNPEKFHELSRIVMKHLDNKTKERNQNQELLRQKINAARERQDVLIQKNVKGVISDEVLSRQLGQIEDEIQSSESLLISVPQEDRNLNYTEMLKDLKEYLKMPGKIWLDASIRKKIELQWFNFPKGIYFDGKEFRTDKIPSIYMAIRDNFCLESNVVPSRVQKSNHQHVSTSDNITQNEEFWEDVGREIVRLHELLYPSEKID